MFKQVHVTPAALLEQRETSPVMLTPNSAPASPQMNGAKKAADRLLSFYPPLDVVDPKVFIAGVVALFAKYPLEVMRDAVNPTIGIPSRLKYLRSLAAIQEVCDELYQPIARKHARDAVANAPRRIGRQPRTPEQQAAVDAQIERVRKNLGILLTE